MFWDSSAFVPLLLPEPRSSEMTTLLKANGEVTMWWGSPVECLSAIYRRHREAAIPPAQLSEALNRLEVLVQDADAVLPSEELRRRAGRILAVHPLRAGDALQLGAALIWCEEETVNESFVCLDGRLREAARREGFTVVPS